jgi:hypothetical protein
MVGVGGAVIGVVAEAKVLNDDTVSPGWLGLVVVVVLGVACVFLFRSFRRQLRKVPPTFEDPDAGGSHPADGGPASA